MKFIFLSGGGVGNKKISTDVDRAKVIAGDITEPMCGLEGNIVKTLTGRVNRIIHLAANVSFEPNDKDGMIKKINHEGTRNIVNLAGKLGIREFHHCSTVYLGGRNPYEISKAEAEYLITDNNFAWNIYRPSAVVGDSRTGHTSDFNGYYGGYAIFHALAEKMRAREMRLFGEVSLPVHVLSSSTSTINLIQQDWVVNTMLKLLKKGAKNEVYNLAHPFPPMSRWVWQTGFDVLGIKDVRYCEKPADFGNMDRKMRIIQKAVDEIIIRYRPYVMHEDTFSLSSVRQALGAEYSDPPKITSGFIYKLLKYAVKMNFGRKNVVESKK